jgi:hypothetical protein
LSVSIVKGQRGECVRNNEEGWLATNPQTVYKEENASKEPEPEPEPEAKKREGLDWWCFKMS